MADRRSYEFIVDCAIFVVESETRPVNCDKKVRFRLLEPTACSRDPPKKRKVDFSLQELTAKYENFAVCGTEHGGWLSCDSTSESIELCALISQSHVVQHHVVIDIVNR